MIYLQTTNRPILVAGSGRSGTTWLSDEIASWARTRPVFEPLHVGRVQGVPEWGVRSGVPGKYVAAHGQDQKMQTFVTRLLEGQVENHWTQQTWRHVPKWVSRSSILEGLAYSIAGKVGHRRRIQGDRMVIKFIKANLMLGWLSQNFDVQIVYVVRHPCQVVGSRLSRGWQSDLADILSQTDLMADHLEPFRDVIESANTSIRQLAVLWCVENLVPLRELRQHQWVNVAYEDFLSSPQEAFGSLGEKLELPVTLPNPIASRSGAKWHHPLTELDGLEVLNVCQEFGIDLYGREPAPQASFDDALEGALEDVPQPAVAAN